jgi:amidase
VAVGTLPIAQGSDGGGSIRIPAALCGLFGHKASRGLHGGFYDTFDVAGLSVAGCLARTVEDAAAWMDGFLGRIYAPDAPPAGSLLAQARQPVPPMRIRLVTSTPLATVPEAWVQATLRAAELLRGLGHEVVPGPELDVVTVDEFLPLYGYLMGKIPILDDRVLQPCTRFVRGRGEGWTKARVVAHAAELVARIDAWWGDVDAVLTPTCGAEAPRIGAWRDLSGEDVFQAAVPLGAFTAGFNIGGQAAASVPMGRDAHGLPVGVQLALPQGQDGRLLALCRSLEAAAASG